jgi:hypothetical protein
VEGCPRTSARIDPNSSTAAFDKALDDGQANTAALDLVAGLQGLKDLKDAPMKASVDAGTIVGNGKLDKPPLIPCRNIDTTGARVSMVLDRVIEQIAEDCFEGDALGDQYRESACQIDGKTGRRREQIDHVAKQRGGVDAFGRVVVATGA